MGAPREQKVRHHFVAIGDELRAARRSVDDLYLVTRQALDAGGEEHDRAKGHYAEALASLRLVDVEVEKLRKEVA